MALIECAECSAKVSDRAKKCPQCGGRPTASGKPTRAAKGCLWIIGSLAILMLIGEFLDTDNGSPRVSKKTLVERGVLSEYPEASQAELQEIVAFCTQEEDANALYLEYCGVGRAGNIALDKAADVREQESLTSPPATVVNDVMLRSGGSVTANQAKNSLKSCSQSARNGERQWANCAILKLILNPTEGSKTAVNNIENLLSRKSQEDNLHLALLGNGAINCVERRSRESAYSVVEILDCAANVVRNELQR